MTVSDRSGPRLHLAAFDHRRSLDAALLALDPAAGRALDRLATKHLIWRGVRRTLEVTASAAVLVDADAGVILDEARAAGVVTALALERSGQRWLALERSAIDTQELLDEHRPDYAKLLVRWHPSDPIDRQHAQIDTMGAVSTWAEGAGARLMLELLVPPEGPDADLGRSDPDAYHDEILPTRLEESIRQLSAVGIVPAMWKIDGVARADACVRVAAAVRDGSDGRAGIVVLGAGQDMDTVRSWFRATAGCPEFTGFAIGRTIWWDAVEGYVTGALSDDDAERLIGDRFSEVVHCYRDAVGDTTA